MKPLMMKLFKNCLFFGAFFTLFTNCEPTKTTTSTNPTNNPKTETKKDNLKELIGFTWNLTGITFYEKDQFIMRPEKEKGLTISFNEVGKLNYVLSVNKCFGNYKAENESLSIQLGGCTKMCCDSKFAMEFQDILIGAKSYKIHDGKYLAVNCEEKILKFERVDK